MKPGTALAIMLVFVPLPAAARGRRSQLIDLTQPAIVAQAVREAGYEAELRQGKRGPFIESMANGSEFTIQFYDCAADKGCASLQFYSWYRKESWYTLDFVNRWNTRKRFLRIGIDPDGDLATYMDVTSPGKISHARFSDLLDWWMVMTDELFLFANAEKVAADKTALVK